MDRLIEGRLDQNHGIFINTLKKQIGGFNKWRRFLEQCGIESEFLYGFSCEQKISLLQAYAEALRRNLLGPTKKAQLAGSTITAAIRGLCSSFRTNFRQNPILESSGERSIAISRQLTGYTNDDPAPKHQKCLPKSVFEAILNDESSHLTIAIGQLIVGALFFGMRSCEYTTVTGERKTKLLCVNNFRFFLGNKELHTKRELHLHQPTSVTITFIRQKNGVEEADITMHFSKQALCPVRAWRSAVLRVLSYPVETLKIGV